MDKLFELTFIQRRCKGGQETHKTMFNTMRHPVNENQTTVRCHFTLLECLLAKRWAVTVLQKM